MKNVFLDTNILLDYIENRDGAGAAQKVFTAAHRGTVNLYASVLTFANMAYVIGRKRSQDDVRAILDRFEQKLIVLPMDRLQLKFAIDNPSKDFEDMLQYQCAIAGGCDVLLTNNKKDFIDFCKIPLFTAAEFLKEVGMS